MKNIKTVTVIGAGLSGLSTAVHLAKAGFQVAIVEKRTVAGGRASSFKDSQFEFHIDNCQHILLGCCTAFIDFLKILGVFSKITFHNRYAFVDQNGSVSYLKSAWLPGLMRLAPSFLRLNFLSLKDKLSIFRAMIQIRRTPSDKIQALDKISFERWLDDQKQSSSSKERFWNMIIVSALNEEIKRVSAKYAFKVFRETFLKSRTHSMMGIPCVPLSELYAETALAFLKNLGVKILFQKNVQTVKIDQNQISGLELNDGSSIHSDAYVAAVPYNDLLKILSSEAIEKFPFFKNFPKLENSPITGIHLLFDRPVTDLNHAIVLDQNIHWIFNKTKDFSLDPGRGQYLALVISASYSLSDLSKQAVVDLALEDLRKVFPKTKEARLLHSSVIKEPLATLSLKPGMDEVRPTSQTPINNLFLAGDWIKTDWPSTMESAVRSGLMAAQALMHSQDLQSVS